MIEEWPKIERGETDEVRAMNRTMIKEVPINLPELIRVRFGGDVSGSMDEKKIHVLQQCAVLLLSSLHEFNTYLNQTRSQTKARLKVDTEAWVFGDNSERVKSFQGDMHESNATAEIIRAFERMQGANGYTHDEKMLMAIRDSLTPEEETKIAQKKIMEIVFEVTDGGSSDAPEARKAVDTLLSKGVIARAVQIGEVGEEEKELFNAVWNDNREEPHGQVVGGQIENLLPAVTELLKKYLGDVRL